MPEFLYGEDHPELFLEEVLLAFQEAEKKDYDWVKRDDDSGRGRMIDFFYGGRRIGIIDQNMSSGLCDVYVTDYDDTQTLIDEELDLLQAIGVLTEER